MNRILIISGIMILLASCNSNSGTAPAEIKESKVTDTLSYPYKALYSSDITVPGKPEYAQMVLTIWKMYERGDIAGMKKQYADSVIYDMANGVRYRGKSSDLLDMAGKANEDLDSMRFDIYTWQSVHINDKNEDWVYVWSAERRYGKDGKADTSLLHEQWKIQNNKVVYFNEYKSKVPR